MHASAVSEFLSNRRDRPSASHELSLWQTRQMSLVLESANSSYDYHGINR